MWLTVLASGTCRLLGCGAVTSFDSSPQLNAWRALLAVAVVFVMLATTGWTAVRARHDPGGPLQLSVRAWNHARVDHRALPDAASPPERLREFFAALRPAQRRHLVHRYPLAVGNMNGAPLTLRYAANRLALTQARDHEERRTRDPRLSPDGREEAADRAARYTSMLRPDRDFLAFDPNGSGRAAEVFGDLAHARRVSVVVPGVDTALMTFERGNRPFTAPSGMGRSLYAAEQAAAPRARTAVIAWADYTAPGGIGIEAATASRAQEGAGRLDAFVRGLPGGLKIALVCHSYGSVVCGVAADRLPRTVTDIAVAGSPGMRSASAAGLGTRARVWATRDAGDWIRDVPHVELGSLGHGADPVGKDFGARVFSSTGAVGHGGYFVPGTASLRNLAHIGTADFGDVGCAPGGAGCRTGVPERGTSRA
nr:alpha/beta hydrolase [Streptomyces sp. SID4926]